jgi:hypothetical protein
MKKLAGMLIIVFKDMMFINSIYKHFDKNNIIQKCQIKATPIVIGVVIRVVPMTLGSENIEKGLTHGVWTAS